MFHDPTARQHRHHQPPRLTPHRLRRLLALVPARRAFLLPGLALAVAAGDADRRVPALVTFLLAASSVTIAGVGSAFWGLVAGLAAWRWLRPRSAAPLPSRT